MSKELSRLVMVEEVQREIPRRRDHLRWYHGAANIFYLLLMHAALIGWLWYGRLAVPYAVFLLLSVFVCVIHQRILSEWFHEATHWNIVADRAWNDRIGDVLISTLNGTRIKTNRPLHFKHHAATEFFTPDDPDTDKAAAATRAELMRGILMDLSGRTAIEAFFLALSARSGEGARGRIADSAWFISLVVIHGAGLLVTVSAGYYDIYPIYFGSLLTLYPVANRFRLYLQHACIREDGSVYLVRSEISRTYAGNLLEQFFLISPMIMYHHDHHVWPSLPYRALRAMIRRSDDPNVYGTRPLALLGKVLVGLG